MIIKPVNIKALQSAIRDSTTQIEGVDLSALDQLVEHVPEDMTATVQAGMTLLNFQTQLAQTVTMVAS